MSSRTAGRRIIDLSHEVAEGVTTYPGFPPPVIDDFVGWEASHDVYPAGTEFRIARITMIANTGTYLDTPAHRYRDGFDLSGLPLDAVVDLPGVLVRTAPRGAVAKDFAGLDVRGRAVLVHTGWDRFWATERYGEPGHPYLSDEAARLLADEGAALVGIDSVNIDDTSPDAHGHRPAHSVLLAAGIPIVEHMCGLEQLDDRAEFTFTAVPPKVRGMGTFPVRAFACQQGSAE